jgi:hypothetical protein
MATPIGRCTRDVASVGWEIAVRPARAGAAWDGLVPHEELIRGWVEHGHRRGGPSSRLGVRGLGGGAALERADSVTRPLPPHQKPFLAADPVGRSRPLLIAPEAP